MKINAFRISGFLLLILLTSCYSESVRYADELDIVYTNYSPDFDFATVGTYTLPERVIEVDDSDFDGEDPEFIDDEYSEAILAQIRQNMNDYGYTEVDKENDPDLVLLVSATTTTNLFYYYDWGYWNWWGYPGYGPGWGWWYPGYFPPVVTGYRSGSVLIQMTWPDGIGVNENIPVLWTAVINGLLEGSSESIAERLRNTVDQSFVQSPYLVQ
ncbi:DUF4136 domain-containing protein [Robertkochia aurantiaca]|uniref:DUF4136 domain-containing protein n=1 Tax=Robertkochia aurantiaca TaxID=2873700 RepID=UPI001CCF3881|nr:DUF4136 domain-containing protein [Robertkochia sp. 3YJGBD-33]